jgi:hypothetical protein
MATEQPLKLLNAVASQNMFAAGRDVSDMHPVHDDTKKPQQQPCPAKKIVYRP